MSDRLETSKLLVPLRDMPARLEAPLHVGDLTLRLPAISDKAKLALHGSAAADLAGSWLPLAEPESDPEAWGAWLAREFCLGWTPFGGRYGGVLGVDHPNDPLVGVIYLGRVSETSIEISYGVAPKWRGQGIATAATKAATEWALGAGGFERVEARIDQRHRESVRVIEKAGFRFIENFKTFVEGTGSTADDCLYARP